MRLTTGKLPILAIVMLAVLAVPAAAENMGQLFVTQQQEVQEKIIGLAEAIPAEKYGWSPDEGVMTVAQVLTHVAGGNFMFPGFAGTKPPEGYDSKALASMTDKTAVVAKLKESFAHSAEALGDLSDEASAKEIDLFGQKTTVAGMLMLMANHQHEHLGQLIAYARSNNVVPPWSK